jgi:hypothetical protein
MHIYVDGVEQTVKVTSGTQNLTSDLVGGCEFYIGHDSMSTIDSLKISTTAIEQPQPTTSQSVTTQPTETQTVHLTAEPVQQPPLTAQWWFWTAIVAISAIVFVVGFLIFKRSRKPT